MALVVKDPLAICRRRKRHGFDPWARKMPWRRAWQPPPVSLPGESHGQESLAGCSPRGRRLGHTECARGARHGLPSSRALRRVLALLTVCPVSGTAHLGIGVCALGPRPHAASAGTTQPVLTHGDSESVPGSGCPHSAFRRALLCSLPVFLCLHRSRLNLWSAWGLFWSALGKPCPITVQAATAGPWRSL